MAVAPSGDAIGGKWGVGHYLLTINGAPSLFGAPKVTGLVEGVRRLRRRQFMIPIRADYYGDTVIDGIYRGGDCFLLCVFKEWQDADVALNWPWADGGGKAVARDWGLIGPAGRLTAQQRFDITLSVQEDYYEVSQPATDLGSGVPSPIGFGNGTGFQTLTASNVMLAPDNDVEVLMGNEARDTPVLLQLFPYVQNATTGTGDELLPRWFETTPPEGYGYLTA